MAKEVESTADAMPSSITDLKVVVDEFMEKFNRIKQEQETLKEDEKALIEEYKDRIDMKELKAAMRVVAIKNKVSHKDAFDNLLKCVEGEVE